MDDFTMYKLGIRTSCDECGRKKRKCDGGTPCRCRLSASPATGLVGMQENAFLSDFFGCIGFMPLTTQSHIRETLVKIMASPATRQPSGSMLYWEEQRQFGTIATEASLSTALEGKQLPMDPSTCIFWCAVALGALVKGSPVESVANYSQLARDALESYSGPPNIEVAKAWTILGYLYGFMGDMVSVRLWEVKFQEYMELSSSFLATLLEQGSTDMLPVGFAEVVHDGEIGQLCYGDLDLGGLESFCAQQQDAPQIDDVADERGVYKYFSQSFKVFEQASFEKAFRMSATARGRSGDDEPCDEGNGSSDSVNPHRTAPPSETVADAIAAGLNENIEFEVLEEAVERPIIRAGIGGLLINGILAFVKAAKGDACGTLERIGRCVEVYERYPGLCRFTILWLHLAHFLLAALAAMDCAKARGLYERLRAAHNPCRPLGSLPVPPLEEWRGISSFCKGFQCRTLEGLIAGEALEVFSTPLSSEQKNCEGQKSWGFDGHRQSGVVSAGIAPEAMIASASVAVCTSGVELEPTTSALKPNQVSAHHVNPPARSAPSPYHPHCESEMVLTTDVVSSSGTGVVHGGGSIAGLLAPDTTLISPGFRETDGPTVETGDDGIAAADWLEVTHAMKDTIDDLDSVSG